MYCDLTLVKECGEFQILPLLTTPTLWWQKRSDFKVINLMLLKVLQYTLELARMFFFWLANRGGTIYKLGIYYFYQQTGLQIKKGKRGRNEEINLYNSLQCFYYVHFTNTLYRIKQTRTDIF